MYGNKDGALVPICGSRTCNVTVNAEEKAATKDPDSVWKSVYYGEMSYTISASGMCIFDPSKFTHRDILSMQLNRQYMTWVCKNNKNDKDFLSGKVMISSFSLDGDMSDLELYTMSGVGDGALSNQNPYEVILLGNEDKVLAGNDGAIIGQIKTNGALPINDNC